MLQRCKLTNTAARNCTQSQKYTTNPVNHQLHRRHNYTDKSILRILAAFSSLTGISQLSTKITDETLIHRLLQRDLIHHTE